VKIGYYRDSANYAARRNTAISADIHQMKREVIIMAFCPNCGTPADDGVKFCPSCGKAMAQQSQQQQPPETDAQDAQKNKVMAILSYIIFFVPLLMGAHKQSKFVKFHANQGTVLGLGMIAFGIVHGILTAILAPNPWEAAVRYYTGSLGAYGVITTILGILWLVPSALCIYGIYNAATGKTKELPVIGKFNIIK
jgi:uncharacterized membrane protein/predicted RNA-binding Zn-ribbon protein involved in translation (DUF1610 family)